MWHIKPCALWSYPGFLHISHPVHSSHYAPTVVASCWVLHRPSWLLSVSEAFVLALPSSQHCCPPACYMDF